MNRPAEGFTGRVELLPDCEAVYGERQVDVTALHDHEVIVPLPEIAVAFTVVAVAQDGTTAPHRHSPDPVGTLVFVPDSSGPISAVRITW